MSDRVNDEPGALTSDEVFSAQTESAGLELRIIAGEEQDELPLVLVSGTPAALRFLSRVIRAVADSSSLPSTLQISPNGAGGFHFAASAEVGIYVQCVPPTDREASPK